MKIREHIIDYVNNHYIDGMSIDTAEQVLYLEGKNIRTECLVSLLQAMEQRNLIQLQRNHKDEITYILKAA